MLINQIALQFDQCIENEALQSSVYQIPTQNTLDTIGIDATLEAAGGKTFRGEGIGTLVMYVLLGGTVGEYLFIENTRYDVHTHNVACQ